MIEIHFDSLSKSRVRYFASLKFASPSFEDVLRHRVGKAKRDELDALAGIDVWYVTSAVPNSWIVHIKICTRDACVPVNAPVDACVPVNLRGAFPVIVPVLAELRK